MSNPPLDSQEPTPSIVFRPAVESDYPHVLTFFEKFDHHMRALAYQLPGVENVGQVWFESFRRTLGRFGQIFVTEVDGEVVGFNRCRIKRVPPYMGDVMVGELMEIWIEPSARRLKLGEKLTRTAIDWMHEQGVHSVEVQILHNNQASLNMCQGIGMQPELFQLRLTWDHYTQET